jgi:hypothetical protein
MITYCKVCDVVTYPDAGDAHHRKFHELHRRCGIPVVRVCGVSCFDKGEHCNGYCTGKAKHPPEFNIPDGWHIELNKKPIPVRSHDYDYWHDDIDEDNQLYGTAASRHEAADMIARIIQDQTP